MSDVFLTWIKEKIIFEWLKALSGNLNLFKKINEQVFGQLIYCFISKNTNLLHQKTQYLRQGSMGCFNMTKVMESS